MKRTPLKLYKICSNIVIESIYDKDYNIFTYNLKELNLPDPINELLVERYKIVNFILKNQS